MSIRAAFDRTLPRVVRAPVRRSLTRWYDRDHASALIDRAMEIAEEERELLPPQPSLGGYLMVRMASLTRGLHDAMVEDGADADAAVARTADATWAIYRRMGRVPGALSRLATTFSTDKTARLRAATSLFRTFPFGPPSYRMEDVPSDSSTVAFDVVHCPVADYFRGADRARLCGAAWCDLDYQLAPMWGSKLERSGTLAGGAARCDFRWHVARSGGLT